MEDIVATSEELTMQLDQERRASPTDTVTTGEQPPSESSEGSGDSRGVANTGWKLFEAIARRIRFQQVVRGLMRAYLPDQAPTDPEAAIDWMNAKHFVVNEGGKAVVISERTDPVLNRRVLDRSSFDDIRKLYSNRAVNVPGMDQKQQPKLGSYWLDHPGRRQFGGIVCAPRGAPTGYYNMWQGFAVDPRQGDWSLMQAHIEKIICAGSPDVYRYVRKWLALAVQRPDTLPEVALVLRGKQGTGKGIFVREFGALFGQHFVHVTHTRHLVGHFNAHLRDAIVVFSDEAFLAGDEHAVGVLKALITEPTISIEQKFRDRVEVRNLTHLIIASNNDWIISADLEERRFCVLDVSDAHMQDSDYFGAIVRQMENGGREAMLWDLRREELADFNPRRSPATAALDDQKLRTMDPAQRWWLKKLDDGCLLDEKDGWPPEVARDDLATDYSFSTGQTCTPQELSRTLAKLLPKDYPRDGKRVSVGTARKRTWRFPALEECRSHFDKVFRFDHQWPEVPGHGTEP